MAQAFLSQIVYPSACSLRGDSISRSTSALHGLLLPCGYNTTTNGTTSSLTCRGWRVGRQNCFWHDTVYYVRQSSYDPPEQPLLNREVRGRLGTRPRLATLVQIGSQSTVVLPRCGWHHRLQISTQVYCHGMADTYKCNDET